ncbi:MAG TPA: hypothetical protein PKX39_08530, partial [Flavobacteriales bacterium]|nr:hypothetical protein [Flavobacteriales bacterium]
SVRTRITSHAATNQGLGRSRIRSTGWITHSPSLGPHRSAAKAPPGSGRSLQLKLQDRHMRMQQISASNDMA